MIDRHNTELRFEKDKNCGQGEKNENHAESLNDKGLENLEHEAEFLKDKRDYQSYVCDTISDYDCSFMNVINLKKMQITNCYLRFMRLAHIGNGLDIYWRKVLDIDMDISFDQYYEMIEYKTSEVLVFMIECMCILYDVSAFISTGLFRNSNKREL